MGKQNDILSLIIGYIPYNILIYSIILFSVYGDNKYAYLSFGLLINNGIIAIANMIFAPDANIVPSDPSESCINVLKTIPSAQSQNMCFLLAYSFVIYSKSKGTEPLQILGCVIILLCTIYVIIKLWGTKCQSFRNIIYSGLFGSIFGAVWANLIYNQLHIDTTNNNPTTTNNNNNTDFIKTCDLDKAEEDDYVCQAFRDGKLVASFDKNI